MICIMSAAIENDIDEHVSPSVLNGRRKTRSHRFD